jgi:hypothetical protein
MVTSQAQRTLVKSPPELWTELSDATVLARHLGDLGDLGELRITRIEPDTLVEGEAEGARGTVEIKASGWGTRVTLRVSRELPSEDRSPEATDASEPPCEQPDNEGAQESAQPEGEHAPLQSSPEISCEQPHVELADEQPVGAMAAEQPAGALAQPQPSNEILGHSPEQTATGAQAPDSEALQAAEAEEHLGAEQRGPGPATEAARRAAGWPAAPDHDGPAIESDLRAAEASVEDRAEPLEAPWEEDSSPWQLEQPAAYDDGEEPPQAEPPTEKRRGFFVRLFGRRRRSTAPEGPPPSEAALATQGDEELALTAQETLDEDRWSQWPEAAGAQHALGEDPDYNTPIEAETPAEDENDALLEADTPADDENDALLEAETPADTDADTPIQAHTPADTESDTPIQAEGPADERDGALLDAASRAEELAVELRAAEEVAGEEVNAVLVAVLDRLGAAHHRPFSRS